MAGSRLEYIGTIFSRTTGLLRTKAIKYDDRPLWYDIYRVFPPKFEPRADRLPELTDDGMTQEVPAILYSEDVSRAALFKKFGKNPGGKARNLMNVTAAIGGEGEDDAVKRFVLKYTETKSAHSDWSPEQIVEAISQEFVGKFGSSDRGMRSTRRSERGTTSQSQRESEPESDTQTSTDATSKRRTSSRQYASSSSSLHDAEDIADEDLDDGEGVDRRRRGDPRTRPVVTVDTLISMFKKAKEKEGNDGDDNDKK